MKSKVVCKNCGIGYNKIEVSRMLSGGFELRHVSCPQCGQQTLANRDK